MIRSDGLLPDRQQALVERFGLRVLPLGNVEPCELAKDRGHIGMIWAEGLFHNRQRTLVERLGLLVLP